MVITYIEGQKGSVLELIIKNLMGGLDKNITYLQHISLLDIYLTEKIFMHTYVNVGLILFLNIQLSHIGSLREIAMPN